MIKKGFTLVELLAVVVILGIISMVTYGIVSGNIKTTKKKSFEISAQNLLESSREYVTKYMEDYDFPDGGILATNPELHIDNNPFKSGVILRNESGQVVLENVSDGTYCVNGTKNNMVITEGDCSSQDDTPPSLKLKLIKAKTNSAQIMVKAQDSGSGINKYTVCYNNKCEEYNKNNEKLLVKDIILLKDLQPEKTYNVKVTVENNSEKETIKTTVANLDITTKLVEEPTFSISSGTFATTKELTITYPENEGMYSYKYDIQTDDAEPITKVLENGKNTEVITINNKMTVRAYIENNGEAVSENVILIDGIDITPPTVDVQIDKIDEWTHSKIVKISSTDIGIGLALRPYSYNNGKSWVKDNKFILTSLTNLKIKVRDRLGNKNKKFSVNGQDGYDEIKIDKIDNEGPGIKLEVIEGTKKSDKTEWYSSDKVVVKATVVDEVKSIDENGNEVIVPGGIGVDLNGIEIKLDNNKGTSIEKIDDLNYKITITENGVFVVSVTAKDLLGNQKKEPAKAVIKRDNTSPIVTPKSALNNYTTAELSNTIDKYLNITYGSSGGNNIECRDITTNKIVTTLKDVYELGKSTRNVKCIVTSKNELSAEATLAFRNYYAGRRYVTGSYSCNCHSYSCNCSSYTCNCYNYSCNCSNYTCNCHNYECNCSSRSCNCHTHCKTCYYNSFLTTSCPGCGSYRTCSTCRSCSTCTACSTCQSCQTCTSCSTCQSCSTCTSCDTCYNYAYACDNGGTLSGTNCYY